MTWPLAAGPFCGSLMKLRAAPSLLENLLASDVSLELRDYANTDSSPIGGSWANELLSPSANRHGHQKDDDVSLTRGRSRE